MTGDNASNGPRQLDDGYLMALRNEINALHVHNGAPSMRVIASRSSHAISHTTVHAVLRCRKLPTWGQLELVIEHLGGDLGKFKQLWIDARSAKGKSVRTSGDPATMTVSQVSQSAVDPTDDEEEGASSNTQVIADLMQELLDDIEGIGSGNPNGVPTGFVDLDRLLNGLSRGQLVVAAGRPAIGKSMFALSVARNASIGQGVPVLIMSSRISKLDLVRRLMSAEARVPQFVLQSGNLTEDDWTKLARRMGEIATAPLFINDNYAPTLDGIVSEARKMSTDHGIGLLIIDSVDQLVEIKDADSVRSKEVEVSRTLKRLALELQIPVVAVDSVPHLPDDFKQMPSPPALEDLNGIDEDADIVIVIHRDDFYDQMSPRAGEADFIVVKHRDGPMDTITVAAQLHLARFVDIRMVQ